MKEVDAYFGSRFTKFEELDLEHQKRIKNQLLKKIQKIKEAIDSVDIDEELKTDKLYSKNASALIWQFVRFNADYFSDYSKFKKGKLDNDFAKKRWLINEFINPVEVVPPKSFRCLKYQSYDIANDASLDEASKILIEHEALIEPKYNADIDSSMFLIRIDSRANLKSILNDVKKITSKFKKKKKYPYHLLDIQVISFLIYHSKRRYGFSEKDTIAMFGKVYGAKFKMSRANKEDSSIKNFLEIANKAPFIFY